MTKTISSEFPPGGQVSIWVYDSVNDKWYAVLGDADGHIQLDVLESALPNGAATSLKQLPDDHNVTVSNMISGFATETKQTTQITALHSIQNLVGALHDVGVDEIDINFKTQSLDVEVKQQTPADLVVAQHQYDGTTWRKSNLLWGYYDRYFEAVSDTEAAVNDTLSTTAVPAGYVYVVNFISAFNNTNAFTRLLVIPWAGASVGPHLIYETNPAAVVPNLWEGAVVLKEDDYIKAEFEGNTLNDDIFLRVWGYKMKIDM